MANRKCDALHDSDCKRSSDKVGTAAPYSDEVLWYARVEVADPFLGGKSFLSDDFCKGDFFSGEHQEHC